MKYHMSPINITVVQSVLKRRQPQINVKYLILIMNLNVFLYKIKLAFHLILGILFNLTIKILIHFIKKNVYIYIYI